MKFLTNKPVILIGKRLIVADLHLGIEYEYLRSGIKIPSQTDKMVGEIKKLIKETKAEELLILGDLKHKVPGTSSQETREVPEFLNELDDLIDIEIVLGNHDAGLKSIISKNIKTYPSKGFLLDNIYFMHGNSWPSGDFLNADFALMGHVHPMFEIKDKLGYRWVERVWVHAELERKVIGKRFGKVGKLPKLVIIPAFNEMVGGKAVNVSGNRMFISPLYGALKKQEIYLLDGLLLTNVNKELLEC